MYREKSSFGKLGLAILILTVTIFCLLFSSSKTRQDTPIVNTQEIAFYKGSILSSFEVKTDNILRIYLLRSNDLKEPAYVTLISAAKEGTGREHDFLGDRHLSIPLDIFDLKKIINIFDEYDEKIDFEINKEQFELNKKFKIKTNEDDGMFSITVENSRDNLTHTVTLAMNEIELRSFVDILNLCVEYAVRDQKERFSRG